MGTRSPTNSRRCPDAPACYCWQVNWLWFGEVGFRSVWDTVLLTRVAIFVAVALVVGGTVFLALMLAYRSRPVCVPAARPTTRARRTGPR